MNNLEIYNEGKKRVYRYYFNSLSEFLYYIKNTEVNKKIFKQLMSESTKRDYVARLGEPFEVAFEHILTGYKEEFDQIYLKSDIHNFQINYERFNKRGRTYLATNGSRVDIPTYLSGSPKCMRKLIRYKEKREINVYFSLGYTMGCSVKAVRNRGIIALKIIQILEEMGYLINLIAFEHSYTFSEEIYVTINLKNLHERINELKCYGVFSKSDFERRFLFRLTEVTPVHDIAWAGSYGSILKENELRERIGIEEDAIYFGTEQDLGITGEDLYDDFNVVLRKIRLQDQISIVKKLEL